MLQYAKFFHQEDLLFASEILKWGNIVLGLLTLIFTVLSDLSLKHPLFIAFMTVIICSIFSFSFIAGFFLGSMRNQDKKELLSKNK